MNISISRDGVEIGEWTEEEVRALYKDGRLVATDFYWREGMSAWKELQTFVKPPPPAPPPSEVKLSGHDQPGAASPETIKGARKLNWSNPLYWIIAVGVIIAAKLGGSLVGYSAAYYPDIAMPMLAGGMIGFILSLIPACIARYYYKTKHSDRYIWMPVAAGAILGLLFGLLYGPIHVDSQLAEASNKMNMTLPKMITEFIRLDSTATGSNRTWHYHYTLIKSKPGLDSTQLNTILKPGILKAYQTNPELKFFRDNRITLEHEYYDADGNMIGTVEVGPNDLQ